MTYIVAFVLGGLLTLLTVAGTFLAVMQALDLR